MERRDAILAAVRQLKAKGVTAIKVELEAQMNRSYDSYDEERCLEWILDKVAGESGSEHDGWDDSIDTDGDEASIIDPFPWMKYAKFYNDGSVDSELTFTIKLDDENNIFQLPHITRAFRELGEEIGGSFDVSGAGMHTALLFSSDCSYPSYHDDYTRTSYSDSNRLDTTMLRNFKRSVTQLLPALYFLGTSNEQSRGLHYRLPRVSVDWNRDENRWGHETKYSAITYRQGAIEYRLFDTCYDNPEATLDNIVVIANTMKYMSTTYKSPGVDKKMSQLNFGCDGNKVERFYAAQSHLEALNIGLAKIKPSYMTVREVKRQRKFSRTTSSIKKLRGERLKSAQIEYDEYDERFKWQLEYRELNIKSDEMRNVVDNLAPKALRDLSQSQLDEMIAPRVESAMDYFRRQRQSATDYIASRLNDFDNKSRGEHRLTFNE